jgi:hypothetical protein
MYYIYKDNLPSIQKIALTMLQFGFFDDFRSKNGLPASSSNVVTFISSGRSAVRVVAVWPCPMFRAEDMLRYWG